MKQNNKYNKVSFNSKNKWKGRARKKNHNHPCWLDYISWWWVRQNGNFCIQLIFGHKNGILLTNVSIASLPLSTLCILKYVDYSKYNIKQGPFVKMSQFTAQVKLHWCNSFSKIKVHELSLCNILFIIDVSVAVCIQT